MIHVCLIEARKGEHVLKCARNMPENYGPNEIAAFKAEVIGFFRVVYREWPDERVEKTRQVRQF